MGDAGNLSEWKSRKFFDPIRIVTGGLPASDLPRMKNALNAVIDALFFFDKKLLGEGQPLL